MASKSFFTKLFDGTYARAALGVKLRREFRAYPSSKEHPNSVTPLGEQLDALFRNIDAGLQAGGNTRGEVVKVEFFATEKGYVEFFREWNRSTMLDVPVTYYFATVKFSEKWREFFGSEVTNPSSRPLWTIEVVRPCFLNPPGSNLSTAELELSLIEDISAIVTVEYT